MRCWLTLVCAVLASQPRVPGQEEGWVVHEVALSADATSAAFGRFHNERGIGRLVLRTATEETEGRELCPAGVVRCIVFSPTDTSVFASQDRGELWQIDLIGGDRVRTFDLGRLPGWVRALAISADGTRVAAADDRRRLQCFAVAGGERLWHAELQHLPLAVRFLPDGRLAVAEGSGMVTLWSIDGEAGPQQRLLSGNPMQLAVDPEGDRLAAAGWNGELAVWDLTNQTVHRREATGRRVYALTFDGKGHRLAVAGQDRRLLVWDLTGGLADEPGVVGVSERTLGDLRWLGTTIHAADFRGGLHRFEVPATGRSAGDDK